MAKGIYPGRISVGLSLNEKHINDHVCDMMKWCGLWQHDGRLVKHVINADSSSTAVPMTLVTLRELIAEHVDFYDKKGRRVSPPTWCVRAVLDRGEWPDVDELADALFLEDNTALYERLFSCLEQYADLGEGKSVTQILDIARKHSHLSDAILELAFSPNRKLPSVRVVAAMFNVVSQVNVLGKRLQRVDSLSAWYGCRWKIVPNVIEQPS